MVYSTRRFVLYLTLCYFVLVFFSPFSIAITSLWEERVNLNAFRTFVRFVLVWFCRNPLPLGVWEGLRFLIVALPLDFFLIFFSRFIHIYLMAVYCVYYSITVCMHYVMAGYFVNIHNFMAQLFG